MRPKSNLCGLVFVLVSSVASPAWAGPEFPTSDITGNGEVAPSDLQCLVLIMDAWELVQPLKAHTCLDDLTCDLGHTCRPGFDGQKLCLPACLSLSTPLGDLSIPKTPDRRTLAHTGASRGGLTSASVASGASPMDSASRRHSSTRARSPGQNRPRTGKRTASAPRGS